MASQDVTNPHEGKAYDKWLFLSSFSRMKTISPHSFGLATSPANLVNCSFAIVFKSVVSVGDVFIAMFRIRLAVVVVISWEKWHFVCDLTATQLDLFTVRLNQTVQWKMFLNFKCVFIHNFLLLFSSCDAHMEVEKKSNIPNSIGFEFVTPKSYAKFAQNLICFSTLLNEIRFGFRFVCFLGFFDEYNTRL